MNIVKRTPFRDFEQFMSGWRWPWVEGELEYDRQLAWRPSVDIIEEDKEFLIKVEVPEVRKEDLHVAVENGILNIKGERSAEVTDKKQHRTERFYGKFERSFTLPENVRDGGIKANMDDGMLYIHLAKADIPRKAMKHEIKVS